MLTVKVRSIDSGNSVKHKNFAWSLKPLLIWMRVIFVDLGTCNNFNFQFTEGFKYKLFTVLGYSLLLLNIGCNLFGSVLNSWYSEKSQCVPSSIFCMNRKIDQINYSLRNIGVHLCLLLNTRGNCKKLWKSVEKISHFMQNETDIYRRFRLLSVVGILYILLMVISLKLYYSILAYLYYISIVRRRFWEV
jgi:hypothetical protein